MNLYVYREIWGYGHTPEERRMAREMGLRAYKMPTLKERIIAWIYQILP